MGGFPGQPFRMESPRWPIILPWYRQNRAAAIVLAIGINDFERRDNATILGNFRAILQTLPASVPVIISAVLPVGPQLPGYNPRIRELNRELQQICASDHRFRFVDAGQRLIDSTGNLDSAYHEGDGVHLSARGYEVWSEELRQSLSSSFAHFEG